MSQLLEVLRTQEQRRIASDLETRKRYRSLLVASAKGEEIDPGEAANVFEAMGLTQDKFLADEEAVQQRLRDFATVAVLPEVNAELLEVTAEQEQLSREHAAFVAKMKARQDAVTERRNELLAKQAAGQVAEARLRNGSTDPALLARERELCAKARVLAAEIGKLDEQCNVVNDGSRQGTLKNQLILIRQKLKAARGPMEAPLRDRLKADETSLLAGIAKLEGRITSLRQQKAIIDAELAEIAVEKLNP